MSDLLKISEKQLENDLAILEKHQFSISFERLGLEIIDQSVVIPFFDRKIIYADNRFMDTAGESLTLAVHVLLAKYLLAGITLPDSLMIPGNEQDQWVTLRELPGAGPLYASFAANTAKTIEQSFSRNMDELELKCDQLPGVRLNQTGYDFVFQFNALPAIPMILRFNDLDDMMPATAGVVYPKMTVSIFDGIVLGILATYLTGRLIGK